MLSNILDNEDKGEVSFLLTLEEFQNAVKSNLKELMVSVQFGEAAQEFKTLILWCKIQAT